jgi:dTMP kinase
VTQPGFDTGVLDPGLASPGRSKVGWRERFLVSHEYSNLWFAQVISAMGDWVGLFAITQLASSISGQPEAATALVLTARVAPSFVLAPFMGVLVDRYDRKLLMRIADIARACVFIALPFIHTVWGLILASLVLEVFTLIWSPAKESLVPKLVPRSGLTQANSLGVLAAYGTMPLAGVMVFMLKEGNDALANVSWLQPFGFHGGTQTLAFYFDALTFLVTAFIVWRFIPTSGTPERATHHNADGSVVAQPPKGFRQTMRDIREGFTFIWDNPVVRAVNIGLAAGLLGGAMLVPLGPAFAKLVIGDTDAFSLYIAALGFGVAAGVGLLTWLQARLPKIRVFVLVLFLSGISISFGVSMSTFWLSAIGVFGLGLGAGAVYVLGFTLLQENTDDELRGRTFSTFLTLVRLCVLGAMVLGPTVSALLDPAMRHWISGRDALGVPAVHLFGVDYALPGVRITLWLGALLILLAAVLSARSINLGIRENFRSVGGDIRHGADYAQKLDESKARHPSRLDPDPPP